ncbi:MAG: 3-isopropylmalate dehydratase small subunit [Thaumarchaeota archaeon]|nr:3-isopropylmalate dehydratase small subunit [Nitrososphaerota archaeon]
MEPFSKIRSVATPLDKVNVDTDQIVPKQFLKLVQKTGFGQYLFYDWRYGTDGAPRKDFVLNDPAFRGSKILLAGNNFGCGSSREHAVWALLDFGFRAVISTSFADIFYNNCFKNGILPVRVDEKTLRMLFENRSEVEIDLEAQTVTSGEISAHFEIESHWKKVLLEGLDDIAATLRHGEEISRYENLHKDCDPRAS